MKAFFLASLLVVAASASLLEEHAVEFQAFKTVHGKSYLNQVEETKRFSIFRDNLRSIEEHNALYEQGLVSYKQGITKFADQTQDELRAYLGFYTKPSLNATKYVKTGLAVPNSEDWRNKGQVGPVKNQGDCGGCWAFSITGSTEAAYFRKYGQFASLSEQQLIDCTTDVNFGCDGGSLGGTFPYIQQSGIETEESYPYTQRDGSCRYDSSKVVTKISNFVQISNDENGLLEAVGSVGPVSVGIDAMDLFMYSSGILVANVCSPQKLNHAVVVVGYGTENGINYWIVRNSWGDGWGLNGFFKIRRGTNECGIAMDNVYPVIN